MEEEKEIVAARGIAAVKRFDPGSRPFEQSRVLRQSLRRRVAEIRQQGEMQVLIPIREMMNLQRLEPGFQPFEAGENVGTTTIVRLSGAMPRE